MPPDEIEPVDLKPPQDLAIARLRPATKKAGRWSKVASWALLVIGLLFTVIIAFLGTSQGGTQAVLPVIALTVASGLFQVISVAVGNKSGKFDVRHVRGLARISLQLQTRVVQARILAEQGYQQSSRNNVERTTLGLLSVNLSQMEDYLVQSVETWRDLNPEIFEEE